MNWRVMLHGACWLGLFLAGQAATQTSFMQMNQITKIDPIWARDMAIGDYNNDGWPDLFLGENLQFQENRFALLDNQGKGRFARQLTAIPAELLWGKPKGGGASFADYDGDGDLDLLVPMNNHSHPDKLLRNNQGRFADSTPELKATGEWFTDNAIWLDFDRDGHLDLYTGNLGSPAVRNKLYRNQGDGTFADATAAAGLDILFHPESGGSGGGMAAGDFNGDEWPDLYAGVHLGRNRLFFNDGQGRFADATTREIADEGEALGVAVGDIDNDGDLDIFQAAGGGGDRLQFRSLMLMNLGGGQFLDVLEGVGLSALAAINVVAPGFADLDNDGDLDLVVTQARLTRLVPEGESPDKPFLFLNQGDGSFVEGTGLSGLVRGGFSLCTGDLDANGFLDLFFSGRGPETVLYLNKGNDNHYLRVELVGIKSNRHGIGSRLVATAGALRQVRELLAGNGFTQDELVVHFGLGPHTQVDRLEVHWPSGQVEVLTDIPADQKIRLFEGREGYYLPSPTTWAPPVQDTLWAGASMRLQATVRPALFETDARITRVMADLSALGGPADMPLADLGDGAYQLEYSGVASGINEWKEIFIHAAQSTFLGQRWTRLTKRLALFPAEDLSILDENLKNDWKVATEKVKTLELGQVGLVYRGKQAGFLQVERERATSVWKVVFTPGIPVEQLGFTAVRFALYPVEVQEDGRNSLQVAVSDQSLVGRVALVPGSLVDLATKDWQVVEIPLGAFALKGPIHSIQLLGNIEGKFYLDDLRLVAATPSPVTVVEEERTASLPHTFSLSQNFPNPFNSDTVIRFALPEGGEVELAVYNLAGQQVVKLAEGVREAGSYTVRWDGRDQQGHELASGVYLYRLRAGEKMEAQKLLLLR